MKKLLLPFVLATAAGCTGDGDGTAGGGALPAPQFDLMLTDAPADELLYLRADVDNVQLQREDLTYTADLLTGTATVDLLALGGVFEWLLSGELAEGTYVGVRIGFAGAGFEAAEADGTPVTINALTTTLDLDFEAPVALADGDTTRVEIDVDLLESLSGDIGTGMLDITPTGSVATSTGALGLFIQPFKGVVTSVDALGASLTVDAYSDGDLTAALGSVEINVPGSALLIDDVGAEYPTQGSFFADLVEDASEIEVKGSLSGGIINATQIQVEDANGVGGAIVAEIRGKVVGLATGTSLELLITEVTSGSATVLPVLSGLGDPPSIAVGLDLSTVYLNGVTPTTESAVAVGQTVSVKFDDFTAEPFSANLVAIEIATPSFYGVAADVSGVPTSLVMNLNAGSPALLSGDVAATTTDVDVQLGAAPITLKAGGNPSLSSSELQDELRLVVSGALSGTPTVPVLTASSVQVLPGRLAGASVSGSDEVTSTFTTFGGEILDPFGAGLTLAPFTIVIDPACTFTGDATSKADFFTAAAGVIEVDVQGLATGVADEINAFAIKTTVLP